MLFLRFSPRSRVPPSPHCPTRSGGQYQRSSLKQSSAHSSRNSKPQVPPASSSSLSLRLLISGEKDRQRQTARKQTNDVGRDDGHHNVGGTNATEARQESAVQVAAAISRRVVERRRPHLCLCDEDAAIHFRSLVGGGAAARSRGGRTRASGGCDDAPRTGRTPP